MGPALYGNAMYKEDQTYTAPSGLSSRSPTESRTGKALPDQRRAPRAGRRRRASAAASSVMSSVTSSTARSAGGRRSAIPQPHPEELPAAPPDEPSPPAPPSGQATAAGAGG